jgi:hypothetical protein
MQKTGWLHASAALFLEKLPLVFMGYKFKQGNMFTYSISNVSAP